MKKLDQASMIMRSLFFSEQVSQEEILRDAYCQQQYSHSIPTSRTSCFLQAAALLSFAYKRIKELECVKEYLAAT